MRGDDDDSSPTRRHVPHPNRKELDVQTNYFFNLRLQFVMVLIVGVFHTVQLENRPPLGEVYIGIRITFSFLILNGSLKKEEQIHILEGEKESGGKLNGRAPPIFRESQNSELEG